MDQAYRPTTDEVIAFYDHAVPMINRLVGDNVHLGYWTSPGDPSSVQEATDRLTDMMIERLGLVPGATVLDLGCGLGAPAVRLGKAADVSVTGVATSTVLVEKARQAAHDAGVDDRVGFQVADALALPFGDGSFDAVLAIESIVHMTDLPRVFSEVRRVLRPGGRIVLTIFFRKEPLYGHAAQVVEAYRRLSLNGELLLPEEFPPLLRSAGLHQVEFLDITRQTMRHHREMIANVEKQRAELEELYGTEMVHTFVSVFEDCLAIDEPGYLLLTAERARETTSPA
ncbi:methyltransferase domain-containing protein [Winogradskya humida]|uniref:Methyltransferase type 11 n=1 Tax=Winogradskya humida TaxID=113566 RepID=A0ABQ4A139_9ACTN|nr:methyltransferase domain-containing protein [Actinoplanes humidus]GIE24575.1 methyltransferase type 11 [Actinoplanes humidus]